MRLKDSLVSSLQFCKAKDAELAWIDGVLDMRVSKVDTGVILEEGELKDDGEDSEMQVDAPSDSSVIAQQKAMKSLFGDDGKGSRIGQREIFNYNAVRTKALADL